MEHFSETNLSPLFLDLGVSTNTSKTCILLEFEVSGHRANYAHKIFLGLKAFGFDSFLIITARRHSDHPALRNILEDPKLHCRLEFWDDTSISNVAGQTHGYFGRIFQSFRRLFFYRDIIRHHDQGDLVLSMFADNLWPAIAVFPNVIPEFSGIFMRTRFHWPHMGITAPKRKFEFINKWLMKRLLSNSRKPLMTFDPTLSEFVEQVWPQKKSFLFHLPDPVMGKRMSRSEARRHLKLPEQGKILSVMGCDERKGASIIEAAILSGKWPNSWCVFLGGGDTKVVEKLKQLAVKFDVEIYCYDGFLPEEDWVAGIYASNLVWAVYPGHLGPSGVIESAIKGGVPFLSSDSGLPSWQAQQMADAAIISTHKDVIETLTDWVD